MMSVENEPSEAGILTYFKGSVGKRDTGCRCRAQTEGQVKEFKKKLFSRRSDTSRFF